MTRPDNYNNIFDNKSYFKITDTQYIPVIPRFFASSKKTHTLLGALTDGAYCLITHAWRILIVPYYTDL